MHSVKHSTRHRLTASMRLPVSSSTSLYATTLGGPLMVAECTNCASGLQVTWFSTVAPCRPGRAGQAATLDPAA